MPSQEERLIAYRRTVTIIATVILLYLSYLIIRPFLISIIGAMVLAYLFYPFYKKLASIRPKSIATENLAAIATVIIIIIIVMVPTIFITTLLTKEARSGYLFIQNVVSQPGFTLNIHLPKVLNQDLGELSQFKPEIIDLSSQFILWLQQVLKKLPGAFLNIFITVFSIYFFLRGGKNINRFLEDFFPLPEGRYKQIFSRFNDLNRGIFLGQIVVGILHGFLAWFAYSLLGIPNPVLWAFVTAVVSIIPVLGSGLVWFPLVIYLYLIGLSNGMYWKGVVLSLYGFFIMSGIDNFLKPKIMGDNAKIHPLIILFGILGGIQLLGLPGIILGPLILALFDVTLTIFREVI